MAHLPLAGGQRFGALGSRRRYRPVQLHQVPRVPARVFAQPLAIRLLDGSAGRRKIDISPKALVSVAGETKRAEQLDLWLVLANLHKQPYHSRLARSLA